MNAKYVVGIYARRQYIEDRNSTATKLRSQTERNIENHCERERVLSNNSLKRLEIRLWVVMLVPAQRAGSITARPNRIPSRDYLLVPHFLKVTLVQAGNVHRLATPPQQWLPQKIRCQPQA
jgi:hypothetical protein